MQIQKSQSPEDTILKIEGLRVEFDSAPPVIAVDGVDLEIRAGQIVGLVGESGSGKTVLSLSILRLLTEAAGIRQGAILWRGKNLLELNREQMRRVRGSEIAMIFQNPQASLNPMRKIGLIPEVYTAHSDGTRMPAPALGIRPQADPALPGPGPSRVLPKDDHTSPDRRLKLYRGHRRATLFSGAGTPV